MSRLPWIVCAVSVVLIVPAAVINTLLDYRDVFDLVAGFGFVLLAVGAAVMGALVATRVPGNAVGWLLLALGAGVSISIACGAYGEVSATTSYGPLPADEWMAWLGTWPAILTLFGATAYLLLLFPDGRYLSPRWRVAGHVIGAGVASSPRPSPPLSPER